MSGRRDKHAERVVIDAVKAAVIRPDDTVLLALARDDYPPDSLHEITGQLAEHFPGAKFVLIAGATVAIQRGDTDD